MLELPCGPGVNFPLLERAIGASGKLTALDDSQQMLAAARVLNPALRPLFRYQLVAETVWSLGRD